MATSWAPTSGNAALTTLTGAYTFIQLHTGAPGANGTNNVAIESTRKAASMAAAAGGSIASNADVAWTNVAGSETYTHFTAWSLVTGGVFGYSGTITGSAVSAGDNFTIPSGSLTASLTLAS